MISSLYIVDLNPHTSHLRSERIIRVENPFYVPHRFFDEDKSPLNSGGNFVPYHGNPNYF